MHQKDVKCVDINGELHELIFFVFKNGPFLVFMTSQVSYKQNIGRTVLYDNMLMFESLKFFRTPILEPFRGQFAKIAHKVVKSKYF